MSNDTKGRANNNSSGVAIWLTGMSGAGKTTLASYLHEEFVKKGMPVEMLDGDLVRQVLGKNLGFTLKDRLTNIEQVTFLANLLVKHGINVICSFITPYEISRKHSRSNIERYVEVYVKCPLDVLIERDPKGLYKKALSGEIKNFTGVSDPYEEPLNFDICVETSLQSEEESFNNILSWLEGNGYL